MLSVKKNNWWNYFRKHFSQIIAGLESGTAGVSIWFNSTAEELLKDLSSGNIPPRNHSEHQQWSWASDIPVTQALQT